MNIEKKLQDYILEKYDSVTQFCKETGIASSTIFTIFQRGIKKSSTSTVLRICQSLKIDAQALCDGNILPLKEDQIQAIDLTQILLNFESANVIYKGKFLTKKQKRVVAFSAKIALQTLLHEEEIENENGDEA